MWSARREREKREIYGDYMQRVQSTVHELDYMDIWRTTVLRVLQEAEARPARNGRSKK